MSKNQFILVDPTVQDTDCQLVDEFRIVVRESPETNDHEVRFLGDCGDIIQLFWSDMIGLDPNDLLAKPSPLHATSERRSVTVARGNCGDIGCGSMVVDLVRSGEFVEWTWSRPWLIKTLRFPAVAYETEVDRALSDFTWESPDRTTARLLSEIIDRDYLASNGLNFSWASGRTHEGAMTVSLELATGPYQILVYRRLDGETPQKEALAIARMLADHPANWPDVEWLAQKPNLGPPSLAGPGWRPYSSLISHARLFEGQ